MVLIDLLHTGLPQTFNLLKKTKKQKNTVSAKHDKVRYACIYHKELKGGT